MILKGLYTIGGDFQKQIVIRQFFKSFYYLLDFFFCFEALCIYVFLFFFCYCRRRISNVLGVLIARPFEG